MLVFCESVVAVISDVSRMYHCIHLDPSMCSSRTLNLFASPALSGWWISSTWSKLQVGQVTLFCLGVVGAGRPVSGNRVSDLFSGVVELGSECQECII